MSNLSAAQQAAIANLESGAAALGLTIDEEARQDAIDQATLFDAENNYIGGTLPDLRETSPSTRSTAPAPPANPDYYVYDKKSYDTSYSVPQTKNLFGANLDVVSRLDKIEFEQFGDGSLRNSIAYIVPWKRASSTARTQVSSAPTSSPFSNFFNTAISNVTDFGFSNPGTFENILGTDTSYIPQWNLDESFWEASNTDLAFNTDLDFFTGDDNKGSLSSSYYSQIFNTDSEDQVTLTQSEAEKRQGALSSEIPIGWRQGILAGGRFLADTLIDDRATGSFVDTALLQAGKLLDTPSGPVYVGNANGLINQALDIANIFGFNVPRGLTTSIQPNLQSNKSKWNEGNISPAKTITDGMWQFLFNPSELALSVGPQFKETETWGVSDEANAGKPLHWTNHKNPELKFSKVLLNGYIFQRSVEDLEQGLIELFMKNPTNDAKHGPRVLEFVWGKKSFGPCVIKDISINEKMWDQGCLVSAEVSFTLVKVPEWTINDGQVSTFDPTAYKIQQTPTKTTPSEAKESDDTEKTQPPEGERDPDQKDLQVCKKIATAMLDTVQLLDNADYLVKRIQKGGSPLAFIGIGEGTLGAIPAYDQMLGYYNNWTRRVQRADSTIDFGSKCSVPYFGRKRTELLAKPGPINSQEKQDFSVKIIGEISSCINSVSKNIANSYAAGKCYNFEDPKGPRYRL